MKLTRFFAVSLLNICLMTLPTLALAYTTAIVSEEYPPIVCGLGDAVYAAGCYNSYCDNTRLYCSETNYDVTYRYWTANFSDEGISYRYCRSNEIMTGVSCVGPYCDEVSIECSQIPKTRYNCEWIGPFSEETQPTGYAHFGNKYANGMMCTGSYCDNHYFYVCQY